MSGVENSVSGDSRLVEEYVEEYIEDALVLADRMQC